jgi:hypothetical protein
MTFTEAAVEVLRSAGKPLHYKKITEIAIERNLLSHVGKTPETTMSSRLATMVKKDRGDAPILKVKPGVFALREFPEHLVEGAEDAPDNDVPEAVEQGTDTQEAASEEVADIEEEISVAAQELPGADVFPQEDDDDDLILANLDDDSRDGRKTRKRRPRRRRDRDSDNGSSADARPERRPTSQGSTSTSRESRPRREHQAPAARAAEPGEPVGRDLSDAIETALRGGSRQARTLVQVAEALLDTGRLAGTAPLLAPTLGAAIRGDNAKRRASGGRPRFREGNGLVSLLEWDLPSDAVNAERDAVRAADRQRQGVHRAFIKRLRDLPNGALLELLATWLNAIGVHSLRAVRADAGDFSLAGTLRRGPEETPLAVTIYRGNQPVGNDAIVALRGALHHFDHARMGWVVTLGQARDGAIGEAHAEGAAPCAIFDGDALAVSMESVGVGIQRASLPLAVLDVELLDSLAGDAAKSSPAPRNGDSEESDPNKRRRSRRRGRRRGARDDVGEEGNRTDTAEASESTDARENADSDPAEVEATSESAPEPTEDTEKKPVEPAPVADAETEQL